MNPVFVIGHRNPDTDSICSAICYAHLKRRLTGGEYIACRAGRVDAESQICARTLRRGAAALHQVV